MRAVRPWCPLLLVVAGCGADESCGASVDTLVMARDLGDLTDESDSPLTVSGTFSTCRREEYYRYRGIDRSLVDVNHARVELSHGGTTGELELCLYVACEGGATSLDYCDVGDGVWHRPIDSQLGFRGCCRMGAGPLEAEYVCDNGLSRLVSEDTADFFIHVCAHGVEEPTPYGLAFSF